MATPTPSIGVAPSSAPSLAFSPGSSIESGPGLSGSYTPQTRIVAYGIRCRANFKVADREFSGELDLHAALCIRRKYEEMGGGSVTLQPEWNPGIDRVVPLKQEQLSRILQTMVESFTVARQGGGSLDIVALYFGTEPGLQLKRLHEVMRLQMEAWGKLVERAIERIPLADRPRDNRFLLAQAYELIAPKELEDIVRIVDPASNEAGLSIDLPEAMAPSNVVAKTPANVIPQSGPTPANGPTLEDMQRRAEADADAAGGAVSPAVKAMSARLVTAGATAQQALELTNMVELMENSDISDDAIADILGSKARGKIDAVRRALKG